MKNAEAIEAIAQDVLTFVFERMKSNGHARDRLGDAVLGEVHEVVILHLAQRNDLGCFVGSQEANAHPGTQRQGILRLEKNASGGHVPRHARDLSEQDRVDADGERLVEAKVLALVAGSLGNCRSGCGGAVLHSSSLGM